MSDLELGLWVLGLSLVIGALVGPGMWSEKWGWNRLERIAGKKPGPPPADENLPPR